jgi:SAM-dependent methyltransferase
MPSRPAPSSQPATAFPVAPDDYDAWYRTPLGAAAHRIELAAIEQLAEPRAGERALDAGCGSGIYSAWLTELGLLVTGVDRDPRMLGAARRQAPSASFREGELTALPFAAGEFDLALAVTVFSFLDERQRVRAARELVRVIRPGGRVVIADLAPLSLWAAQRRVKAWLGSATWRAARFTSARVLHRLLLAAGADRVRTRYALYVPPIGWPPLLARAELLERLRRPLGPVGAAFVVAGAERPPASLTDGQGAGQALETVATSTSRPSAAAANASARPANTASKGPLTRLLIDPASTVSPRSCSADRAAAIGGPRCSTPSG